MLNSIMYVQNIVKLIQQDKDHSQHALKDVWQLHWLVQSPDLSSIKDNTRLIQLVCLQLLLHCISKCKWYEIIAGWQPVYDHRQTRVLVCVNSQGGYSVLIQGLCTVDTQVILEPVLIHLYMWSFTVRLILSKFKHVLGDAVLFLVMYIKMQANLKLLCSNEITYHD